MNEEKEFDGPFEIEGSLYYVDFSMSFIQKMIQKGGWEIEKRNEFLRFCKEDKYSIDVGTHIGMHLIPMAKKSKKVFGFEPNKRNHFIAKLNLLTNELENKVELLNAAAGCTKKGKVSMLYEDRFNSVFINEANEHLNQLAVEGDDGDIEIIVIDDFLQKRRIRYTSVSFIKIDVEGYEFKVLQGAKKLLTTSPDIAIYLETHPGSIIDKECREKCYDLLELWGYERLIEFNDNEALWKK